VRWWIRRGSSGKELGYHGRVLGGVDAVDAQVDWPGRRRRPTGKDNLPLPPPSAVTRLGRAARMEGDAYRERGMV
jgi:hypothetical protein